MSMRARRAARVLITARRPNTMSPESIAIKYIKQKKDERGVFRRACHSVSTPARRGVQTQSHLEPLSDHTLHFQNHPGRYGLIQICSKYRCRSQSVTTLSNALTSLCGKKKNQDENNSRIPIGTRTWKKKKKIRNAAHLS